MGWRDFFRRRRAAKRFEETANTVLALGDQIAALRREQPDLTDQQLVGHVLMRMGWPAREAPIVEAALDTVRKREAAGRPWPLP